jgi:hypothetical protein
MGLSYTRNFDETGKPVTPAPISPANQPVLTRKYHAWNYWNKKPSSRKMRHGRI